MNRNNFFKIFKLRSKRLQKKLFGGFQLVLLLSLLFHLIFLSVHFEILKPQKPSKVKKIKLVLRKTKDLKKKRVKERKIKKKMQIVNNEDTGRKERAKDSRFLGENDQTYDRQTVARKVDIFQKAGKGVKTGAKQVQVATAKKKASAKKQRTRKFKKLAKRGRKKISLSDLGFNKLSNGYKKVVEKKEKVAKFNKPLLGQKNGEEKKIGLASNNDFIEELPLSDMTNLNTTEFKYYGFYHRIRQKLEQYWGNSLNEKAKLFYKQGRRLANEEKITSLVVTLDLKGNVLEVSVKGSSGVRELDDAAIESFNRAGPFPNPPKGMMENGVAKLNWGFVVQIRS